MRKVAFALVALVLMACGSQTVDPRPGRTPALAVDVTPEMVVGAWRNAARDATFVFAADGTMQGTNVPPEYFLDFQSALTPGFDRSRDRIDAVGSWALPGRKPSAPAGLRNVVELTFEPGGFIQTRGGGGLDALSQGSQTVLEFRAIVFTKCPGPCAGGSGASPSPSR
ncbi:hypothetical protein AB0K00_22600 [Dactylosporangium sp. NPDC049525]|uniref:hypothetical protein n=1 Tax=Dactylosporangium sp. NPDC049525 TaxID=3154730 RepID=UPI003437CB3D